MDNNEKKQTLADVLSDVLGADFDAEKLKALESGVNAYVGKTTVPKPVFNSSNNKLKELQAKLAERAEKQKGAEEWKKQLDEKDAEYQKQLKAKDDAFNDYRLMQALKDGKAKNPITVKALLDCSKLTFDADAIGGLDEQLAEIKKDNGFLFDIPANSIKKGADFPANSTNPSEQTKSAKTNVI